MAQQYTRLNGTTGGVGGGSGDAINVDYDNSSSGLSATDVQNAIDELKAKEFRPLPLITLTGANITSKSVSIGVIPSSPSLTRLSIGGVRHEYGTDYTVTGSTLSWSGLTLDGILEAGDKLQIELR